MSEKLLEVKDLKTYFYTMRGIVRAVDGVSIDIGKGEGLGLAGESGCGKSTLAYSIVRLVPPPGRIVEGQVIFMGTEILGMNEEEFRNKVRWKGISMIFQGAMNALNPVYTIGDQLAEALMLHGNLTRKEALEEAGKLLEMVGIEHRRLRSYPHELSGGMKQRVIIAMALALKPPLIIADEPTTALDVVVQAQIMNLLKKLKRELGLSVMLISHDLSVIAEIADSIAIMYGGKIVERGPSDIVYMDPKHPYTQGLLGAIPRLRGELRDLTWIPGTPPDLTKPPAGCRFAPRCRYASERCQKDPPEVEIEKGHHVACWLYAWR